jgi:lipopolysaccharide export system permease protein
VFNQVSENMTVYVRSRDTDGTLRGILVDDERDKDAPATILAERGRLVEGPSGPRVVLFNGSRQQIDRQNGRLDMLTFGQNTVDLSQNNQSEGARLKDMSEVTLGELLNPHPENVQDIPKWIAEGHKRLAGPLTGVSYAMVALVSVLTGTFRRHGSLVRPLAAIGAVVALLATGLAFGNLAARNNMLLPLVWLHAIVPGVVCAWALFGPRLPRLHHAEAALPAE